MDERHQKWAEIVKANYDPAAEYSDAELIAASQKFIEAYDALIEKNFHTILHSDDSERINFSGDNVVRLLNTLVDLREYVPSTQMIMIDDIVHHATVMAQCCELRSAEKKRRAEERDKLFDAYVMYDCLFND